MPRIKDASVREAIDAADMVEVVSGRTQLRKTGARYVGRCPFHEERTPSFSVNAQDKLFYCFGCGKGGDVITFVRETEQLDFAGAVEWLAERFRVTLEYEELTPQFEESRRRRERLHALLDQAASFYERHLWETAAGEPVRAYLESRGLSEPACREFRLGLSPGRGLAAKAEEKGFTRDELRRAGLTNARGNDYFPAAADVPARGCTRPNRGVPGTEAARGRPSPGQVREFTGGRALPQVGDPLRAPPRASCDCQAGTRGGRRGQHRRNRAPPGRASSPWSPSMGTALTEQQLKELQRLTRRLYLCFDADAAGEDATLRGMELADKRGFEVRVVTMPAGTDPADEPERFEERLAGAESYVMYRVRLEDERTSERQSYHAWAQRFLNGIPDSPERHQAWRYVSDRLGMTVQLQARASATSSGAASRRVLEAGDRLERDVLAACFAFPELLGSLEMLAPEHFDNEQYRRLRTALLSGERDGALAELDAVAAAEAIDETTAKELLLRLRERHLRRRLANADLEETAELQQKLLEIREAVAALA